MLKVLTIWITLLYLWDMERVQCPICKASGLTPVRVVKRGRIVHENEHYKHLVSGGFHYLVRTKLNIVEELSLTSVTN